MARGAGNLYRAVAVGLAGFGLAAAGCVHTHSGLHHAGPPIVVPPPGAVPRELDKVTLPEYVIEPPDVLRIEVTALEPESVDPVTREPKRDEQNRIIFKRDILRSLPLQPIYGEYTVRPDGTVYFGAYGSVNVAGYTLGQAAAAIREHVGRQSIADTRPEYLLVVLDVTQYNSKKYYVITDGGGAGEQVLAFPVTGSETVLDALSNVGGLSPVSSKRNIWVARRTPHPGEPEQILPVDWIGLTQHGVTATNYQIFPGDRVYVKAQRLVTVDNTLARILAPVERVFGVTLLGTSMVNQISGRGFGFNGN
jgi:polysaccharide export outer membrane protein